MFRGKKTWHMIVLVLMLAYVIYAIWYHIRFSFDGVTLFHVDSNPWTFYIVSRVLTTAQLCWTTLFIARHTVPSHREESSRIITRV